MKLKYWLIIQLFDLFNKSMANYYDDDDDDGDFFNLGQIITTDCCDTLNKACERGHIDCIKFLISHDTNGKLINAQDKNGSTPLHYAVYAESIKFAELLLDAGADLLLVDQKNRTAKDLAVHCKNKYWRYDLYAVGLYEQFETLFNIYEMGPIKEPDHE
jgi:hypothetical protein